MNHPQPGDAGEEAKGNRQADLPEAERDAMLRAGAGILQQFLLFEVEGVHRFIDFGKYGIDPVHHNVVRFGEVPMRGHIQVLAVEQFPIGNSSLYGAEGLLLDRGVDERAHRGGSLGQFLPDGDKGGTVAVHPVRGVAGGATGVFPGTSRHRADQVAEQGDFGQTGMHSHLLRAGGDGCLHILLGGDIVSGVEQTREIADAQQRAKA